MSPADAKLWKHLRAHQMGNVHFPNHTCPAPTCTARRRTLVLGASARECVPDGKVSGSGWCQEHAIGNYVVDFSQRDAVLCAPRKKLIMELDGPPFGRNIWNGKSTMRKERSIWNQGGYQVLRFWNNDVMNNIDNPRHAV
jgi:very-short-patch-repair endonuclease